MTVPRLGSIDESDEVHILRWIKSAGDGVEKGGWWLEVEPDKAVLKSTHLTTAPRIQSARTQGASSNLAPSSR